MTRTDFKLDDNYDKIISNGDFLVDFSDSQNVELLLQIHQGHIRHNPLAGVGIIGSLNSPLDFILKQRISKQLIADGYKVNLIYKDNNNKLKIDFS